MSENLYMDCDRCGEKMQVSGDGLERVVSYWQGDRATLCMRCYKKRTFDQTIPYQDGGQIIDN